MMLQEIPLTNFSWITEGLLAVGDAPSSEEKMDWLLKQGFEAIVAPGYSPDNVMDLIRKARLSYFFGSWRKPEIMEYLASHFYRREPIYIFGNSGAEPAFDVAKEFVAQQDLHVVNYLSARANDLNHGDDYDWRRGHEAFHGGNIHQAIYALIMGMSNQNEETRLAAADTLAELMEHAGHGCFPGAAVEALRNVRSEVEDIVLNLNPKFQSAYEKIFESFDRQTK
jgi:hypothetical protein